MLFEKIENNKKVEEKKIDPYFLKDQFWLPNKDDWDESFCKLIKEKSEENQRQLCEAEGEIENEKNNIPQEILEKKQDYIDRSFNQTLHNLGFEKDDLRDKRVLDLGFGDGIFLEKDEEKSLKSIGVEQLNAVAFGILQACRVRVTKTEYISCPSCGRTMFNLQTVIARVKASTSHLKGLKIAIMGCIVNGPGEMADADYGYVGAGRGKVSLYKKKEILERNIDENEAVDKLVELIRANGDWHD